MLSLLSSLPLLTVFDTDEQTGVLVFGTMISTVGGGGVFFCVE
jgi:hypothetical protein